MSITGQSHRAGHGRTGSREFTLEGDTATAATAGKASLPHPFPQVRSSQWPYHPHDANPSQYKGLGQISGAAAGSPGRRRSGNKSLRLHLCEENSREVEQHHCNRHRARLCHLHFASLHLHLREKEPSQGPAAIKRWVRSSPKHGWGAQGAQLTMAHADPFSHLGLPAAGPAEGRL